MGPSGHTAALICTVFEKVEVSMWVSGALVRSRMLAGKNRCRDLLQRKQIAVKKVGGNQVQYLKQSKIQLQKPWH